MSKSKAIGLVLFTALVSAFTIGMMYRVGHKIVQEYTPPYKVDTTGMAAGVPARIYDQDGNVRGRIHKYNSFVEVPDSVLSTWVGIETQEQEDSAYAMYIQTRLTDSLTSNKQSDAKTRH